MGTCWSISLWPCDVIWHFSHHWFRSWLVSCLIPSHYLNKCWLIVDWTLRNKLQWNMNQNTNIFLQGNAFKNVTCKLAAIMSRPQCINCSLITADFIDCHHIVHLVLESKSMISGHNVLCWCRIQTKWPRFRGMLCTPDIWSNSLSEWLSIRSWLAGFRLVFQICRKLPKQG